MSVFDTVLSMQAYAESYDYDSWTESDEQIAMELKDCSVDLDDVSYDVVLLAVKSARLQVELGITPMVDRFRHVVCSPYSENNLHATAERLGIGRHWFHRGSRPHYDSPKRMHGALISALGATDPREIVRVIRSQVS